MDTTDSEKLLYDSPCRFSRNSDTFQDQLEKLLWNWSGGTEEVTSRYRILLHARPRSGIGGGRGPGAILLRPSVRTCVRASVDKTSTRSNRLFGPGKELKRKWKPCDLGIQFSFSGTASNRPPGRGAHLCRAYGGRKKMKMWFEGKILKEIEGFGGSQRLGISLFLHLIGGWSCGGRRRRFFAQK